MNFEVFGPRLSGSVLAALFVALCAPDRADADVFAALKNPFQFSAPAGLNQNYRTDSGSDTRPAIATDNAGTWIAVWESTHDLKRRIGTDKDILYSISIDGTEWSNPKWLNTNARVDSGDDSRPDIAYNPHFESWMVAWHTNDSLGGTIGSDTDIVYATSSDSGVSWTDPTHIDANATSDTGSDLNVDLENEADDDTLAVWQSNDSRAGTIGTDWDIIGASNTNAASVPTGVWSDVAAVNSDAASDSVNDRNPNAAAPPDAQWHVVWERQIAPGDRDIYATRNTGDGDAAAWQSVQTLSSLSEDERFPVVAVDKGTHMSDPNRLVVAWESKTAGDWDIQFSTTINGTDATPVWSARKNLNSNAAADTGHDRAPQIYTDGLGRWLCVWHSRDDLNGKVGSDWDIFWSRSTNLGKTWSGARALNSDAISDSRSDQRAALISGFSGAGLGAKMDFSTGVGSGPALVALGDLNHDGAADVVTSNFDSSTISVLLGNGDGTLGPPVVFAVGRFPNAVALGHLDQDGVLDAVTANVGDHTISALIGNGSGGFGTITDTAVGCTPASVALSTLDAGDTVDVVTANNRADSISVLFGDGFGGFGVRRDFATGEEPIAVAVGDLDGDDNPDVVVANNADDTISVLLGDGVGGFGTKTDFATAQDASAVALADLNGDSALDAVVVAGTDDVVSVLLGNGAGGFAAKTDYATGLLPSNVALADLNDDGAIDAVTSNFIGNSISVLLGDGSGGFRPKTDYTIATTVNQGPFGIALSDLNNDGAVDAVSSNPNAHTVSVLPGRWVRKWFVSWHSNVARDGADSDNDVFVVHTTNDLNDTP